MSRPARYHHGDLHSTLLREANRLLDEDGIDGLSLRKLAERAGVSRTAPYHHFRDKNVLLCALATQAFSQLDEMIGRQLQGKVRKNGFSTLSASIFALPPSTRNSTS